MQTQTLHYKTNTFEGPLDLLLELIEDRKLPINNIALAEVTEQFLNHIRGIEQARGEILADFLNVAAKLLVIKSKTLLPSLEVEEEEEDETDLTEQLKLLKQYREAAKAIRAIEGKGRQSWAREPYVGEQVVFYPDPEVSGATLAKYANKLTESLKELITLPDHKVEEVISISEKISHLQQEISAKLEIGLYEILKNSESKTEIIVTFLALLELIKQKILTVEQEEMFANIVIKKKHESIQH